MLATKEQRLALVSLFKQGTCLSYKKGELIIRDGDTPSGVFYIKSGLVKAYDITRYGEENLLSIRRPREIFPLIWAVTGDDWHVMYEALSPTTLYRIDRQTYYEAISTRHDLLAPLLDLTIEQYKLHSQRILNLEYRTARERLISFLLIMGDRFGKKTKDGILVDVPLRQQDVASSINTSRETTSRELSALEQKGLIKTNPMYVVLKDTDKLRSIIQ